MDAVLKKPIVTVTRSDAVFCLKFVYNDAILSAEGAAGEKISSRRKNLDSPGRHRRHAEEETFPGSLP